MRSFILVLKKILTKQKMQQQSLVQKIEDGYTFIFEVPASEQVQTFSIVPFSVKNQKWYTNMALKLNVPGMKAPEPTATPEPTAAPEPTATPLPTAAPTQAPAE